MIEEETARMKENIDIIHSTKRERLRTLDFFILDNSIRESTVGQLRSHTIEDKKSIYRQVKRCGITNMIVATFAHLTNVDDDFCQWLQDEGEDFSQLYSFSEVSEGLEDGVYDTETLPISLRKNKQYGLYNTILEVDLMNPDCAWGTKFTVSDMCGLIKKWMMWVYTNINANARILVNIRDLPQTMLAVPERVLEIIQFLAVMPDNIRTFGVTFEDPAGEYFPEELEAWTSSVRRIMNLNGWSSGKLLVHIHQRWDLQTACQLGCLSAGSDGVWASLCDEGAALGHACSAVTLTNLIRLGNTKVLEMYNCTEVRKAAIEVTKQTTGREPHPKQVVYGKRSVDLVFGAMGQSKFNLPDFFGIPCINRISTLATNEMIRDRLVDLFGENEQFTVEMALKMKEKMVEDLRHNNKKEYMTGPGIALLFDRSGGKMTPKMVNAMAEVEVERNHHKVIIGEIRKKWDSWNLKGDTHTDSLDYGSFFHGFFAPYSPTGSCECTKVALRAINFYDNGRVHWKEFMVYISWALNQYPRAGSANEVMAIALEEGLVPVMREEKIKNFEAFCESRFLESNCCKSKLN